MSRKSPANSNEDAGRSSKKKGGGFLARQAKAKKAITEEDLLRKDAVSPDDVVKLAKNTESKLLRASYSTWSGHNIRDSTDGLPFSFQITFVIRTRTYITSTLQDSKSVTWRREVFCSR